MEHEKNNTISFLDVKIIRHSINNSLSTSIFKKSTHTDRYLHFNSHHPKNQKLTVAKTLYNIAELTHTFQTVLIVLNIARTLNTLYCSTVFHENTPVHRNSTTTPLPLPNTNPLLLYLISRECLIKFSVFLIKLE